MRKKICNRCNSENPNEAVFCRHCGKRFGKKPLEGDDRKGYLLIQSVPAGEPIWIGKHASGKTPKKVKLDEGEYRVYIGNNNRPDSVQTVYVRRNEISYINVKLANSNSQTIQSSGKIFGQTNYSRDGIILVQCSQRNVVVKIDDHYVGIAPLKTCVKEGLHKVYLSAGLLSKTYPVNVRRGEIAYVKANFELLSHQSNTKPRASTTKSKVASGCFWSIIIALLLGIGIAWWRYSNNVTNNLPATEEFIDTIVVDSIFEETSKSPS